MQALSAAHIQSVNERLTSYKNLITHEIQTKPCSLLETDGWKATEFRQFLLYTGKLALHGILRLDLITSDIKHCNMHPNCKSNLSVKAQRICYWVDGIFCGTGMCFVRCRISCLQRTQHGPLTRGSGRIGGYQQLLSLKIQVQVAKRQNKRCTKKMLLKESFWIVTLMT